MCAFQYWIHVSSLVHWQRCSAVISSKLINELTPWSRVLEKYIVTYLIKRFPAFMEPKGCRLHNSPLPGPIPSHMNQFRPCLLKIHFNIILPSTPMFSEWSLFLRISNRSFVKIANLPMRATCSVHLVLFILINLIIVYFVYLVNCTSCGLLVMRFSPASCHFLFSNTFKLWSLVRSEASPTRGPNR
jgi:hypothetical protein